MHTSMRHRLHFHGIIMSGFMAVIIPTLLLTNQIVLAQSINSSFTPSPTPTSATSLTNNTISPTPTPTTSSTITLQNPTDPTSTTTSLTNPTPTSTMVTTTVTPFLMVANTYKPLTGSTTISVDGSPDTKIDIQLQPDNGQVGSLFITRITINSSTKAAYSWNTINTPDGFYKLYAIFHHDNQPDIILGPVQLQIANNMPSTVRVTPVASTSASPTPANQTDVAYPAEFSPTNLKTDSALAVDPPTNITQNNQLAISFHGKSLPNTVLTLLIFSNPIVVTVKADANGVWTYNLDKPLTPGKHEAYVVVTKPDKSRVRSEVASFFVAPALAASQNGESLQLASATEDNLTTTFIVGTAIIIILGVGGVASLYLWKRRRQPTYAKAPTAA